MRRAFVGLVRGRGSRGCDLEGCTGVERAAEDPPSLGLGYWNWFAGQRRLIDCRRLRYDVAIDRDDFASLYDELIADFDLLDGRVLDLFPDASVRDAGRSIDERAQAALGSGDRDFLKHVAAGIHESDDRSGQRLTQSDRRAHGNKGDGVDAEPPGNEVSNNGDRKSDDLRDRRERPAQLRQLGPAGKARHAACC